MANVVKQRVEKRDRKIVVRVINFELSVGFSGFVPKNPRGEERVKRRLNKRRAKEPIAFLVIALAILVTRVDEPRLRGVT